MKRFEAEVRQRPRWRGPGDIGVWWPRCSCDTAPAAVCWGWWLCKGTPCSCSAASRGGQLGKRAPSCYVAASARCPLHAPSHPVSHGAAHRTCKPIQNRDYEQDQHTMTALGLPECWRPPCWPQLRCQTCPGRHWQQLVAAWLLESPSCCWPCCLTNCSWGVAQWQEVTPRVCAGCPRGLCFHLYPQRGLCQSLYLAWQKNLAQNDSSTASLHQRSACGLRRQLHPETSRPRRQFSWLPGEPCTPTCSHTAAPAHAS